MRGDIEKIFAVLNKERVRYLVVGGLAVVLHGHLRTTMDLDLVIQLDEGNVGRALKALQGLGFVPVVPVPMEQFADSSIRETWIRDKNMIVFSLWRPDFPLFKLDLFVSEPFDFEATYRRALRLNLGEAEATVVALDDLISLKREAGRPQDLADIEALEGIRSQGDRSS